MTHDQLWGSAAIAFAIALFAVLLVAGAAKIRREEEAAQRARDAIAERQALRLANEERTGNPLDDSVVIDEMEVELVIESATRHIESEWWLEDGGGAA